MNTMQDIPTPNSATAEASPRAVAVRCSAWLGDVGEIPTWLDCGKRECCIGVREINQKFIVEAKCGSDMEPELAMNWNFCPWCALPSPSILRKSEEPTETEKSLILAAISAARQSSPSCPYQGQPNEWLIARGAYTGPALQSERTQSAPNADRPA